MARVDRKYVWITQNLTKKKTTIKQNDKDRQLNRWEIIIINWLMGLEYILKKCNEI